MLARTVPQCKPGSLARALLRDCREGATGREESGECGPHKG